MLATFWFLPNLGWNSHTLLHRYKLNHISIDGPHKPFPHIFTKSVVYVTAKISSGALQHMASAKLQQIQMNFAYKKDDNMADFKITLSPHEFDLSTKHHN